jgi:hypothetical protein
MRAVTPARVLPRFSYVGGGAHSQPPQSVSASIWRPARPAGWPQTFHRRVTPVAARPAAARPEARCRCKLRQFSSCMRLRPDRQTGSPAARSKAVAHQLTTASQFSVSCSSGDQGAVRAYGRKPYACSIRDRARHAGAGSGGRLSDSQGREREQTNDLSDQR